MLNCRKDRIEGMAIPKIIHEMEDEGILNVEKDPMVGNRISLK